MSNEIQSPNVKTFWILDFDICHLDFGFLIMVSSEQIQTLRQMTGAGILEARNALQEADGNVEKAQEILRKKGTIKAAGKATRVVREGRVEAYIHSNKKIGVLLKLYCETDFVARNEQFSELAHDLALHIAAANPQYLSPADIPEAVQESERRIYAEQVEGSGKPDHLAAQIVEGKMAKFAEQVCLLKQPFIKDPDKTIEQIIAEYIARIGENIQVGEFVRYEI